MKAWHTVCELFTQGKLSCDVQELIDFHNRVDLVFGTWTWTVPIGYVILGMITEATIFDLFRGIVTELQTLLPAERHSWTTAQLERTDTSFSMRGSQQPDFERLILFGGLPTPLKSIRAFSECLESDGRYQRIYEESTKPHDNIYWCSLRAEDVLSRIVTDYLKSLETLEFSKPRAVVIAREFVRCLGTGISPVVCSTTIRGFTADFDEYSFDSGLRIRRLAEPEILAIFNRSPPMAVNAFRNPFVLELRGECRAGQYPGDLILHARERFSEIIAVLRLVKAGGLDFEAVWVRRERPGQLPIVECCIGSVTDTIVPFPTYSLRETDLPRVAGLLAGFKKCTGHERLRNAISRVNCAAERKQIGDQVIDLMIALEALYGDGSGAIGYKIALRCSKFTETDLGRREAVFGLVRDFFDKRSRIVHGSTKDLKDISGGRSTELLSVVQKSISMFLDRLNTTGTTPRTADFDRLLLE